MTSIFKTKALADKYFKPYDNDAEDVQWKIDLGEISVCSNPEGPGSWNEEGRWILDRDNIYLQNCIKREAKLAESAGQYPKDR